MGDGKPGLNPPGGLAPERVPQFVVVGTDDNATAGLDDDTGMGFLLNLYRGKTNPAGAGLPETFDGVPIHFSMYGMGEYLWNGAASPPAEVKRAWRIAADEGHDLGTHTESHPEGRNSSISVWREEISSCERRILQPHVVAELEKDHTGIGISRSDLIGFRAPYLQYNNAMFKVLRERRYRYDCSVEEGYQKGQDGSNHYWPYLLDWGSPSDPEIEPCPGLWEIPVYPFIAPPDDECVQFGLGPGLRGIFHRGEAAKARLPNGAYGHALDGRMRGMDYDMWETYDMTGEQAAGVLKHTLDKHLNGNRAPMTVCLHTDLYKDNPWAHITNSNAKDRKGAIRSFIEHALGIPEVRVVSARELVGWLENPVSLGS